MMNQTPSAERTHEIDLLRGLACLAVVMFHFLYRGQLDGWVSGEVPAWLAWVSAHGYLGVHLFFMISGYVIFMSAQGATPRAFVASRVARLYPAHGDIIGGGHVIADEILKNHPDGRAQAGQVVIAQVAAIQQDAALIRVV